MDKEQTSKNLRELRDLALTITRDRKIALKWSERAETASYNPELDEIELTDNCLPRSLRNYPKSWRKALDGLVSHEAGHRILTQPIWGRFKRFENRKKYKILAHMITNIIEDKRVNRFIENRYRFDLGKRLNLVKRLIKGQIEEHYKNRTQNLGKNEKAAKIMSYLIAKGLYEANTSILEKSMDKKELQDAKKALKLLEDAQYFRVKVYLIDCAENIYNIVASYIISENEIKKLIPQYNGGEIDDDLAKELENELKDEEKDEDEAKKQNEDLHKGGGAGRGTGDELSAPEPDFERYLELVTRNKPEIERLLSKLKRFVKPIVKRDIFQKRGRILPQILNKAVCSSFNKPIDRVYIRNTLEFEKQKVAIGLIFDLSGSMNEEDAKNCTTILNEVFGNWLEDKAYAIMAFASEFCKIKTFFEQFSNTKARIGGNFKIGGGTTLAPCLKAMQELFNGMNGERQKILVLVSDFKFYNEDKRESSHICENLSKSGVKLLFVHLGSYYSRNLDYCQNLRNTFKISIVELRDLPELFVEIYEKAIDFKL